ncbi:MAG: TolC family protein [Ignavibacteriales bacterium]
MLKYFTVLFLFISVNVFSQDVLTLEKAVKIGLDNNYSIKLARNESAVAANNVTLGNAGFLPRLDATAGRSSTISNVHQEYTDGTDYDKNSSTSGSTTAGIALNWTIFDGMNMFISYGKLRELNEQGEINARAAVENNVASIMSGYYNIVSIQQQINAIRDAIRISEERVRIAEDKYNIGSGSKLELMQARVDLNADRSNLLRQELSLAQAKVSLNQLLGLESNKEFVIRDTILVNAELNYNALRESITSNNNALKAAGKSINLASLNLSGLKSQWYPALSLSAGYNFSRGETQVGSTKLNQSLGATIGLNLSMNIFSGFNTSRQIENARISLMSSQMQYDDLKSRIESGFEQEFINYKNSIQQVAMEIENLDVARQNAEIALDRFKYGSYSSLELSIAQKSYLDAQSRLVAAQYAAKRSEIELMRLSGQIVKR